MTKKLINWWLSKLNQAAGKVWQQGIKEFINETGLLVAINV